MTYLIGAILIVLLIGLVLVFRPPKQEPYEDISRQDVLTDDEKTDEDQLDLEIGHGKSTADDTEEELVLNLDEKEVDLVESGAHEEEGASEQTLESSTIVSTDDVEEIEELDMDLIGEDGQDESTVGFSEVSEEKGSDEFDEDIPFIDEGDEAFERKGDMAPALADIPDDFVQTDEEDMPEELAERLEYFLGTDDEEVAEVEEEPAAEQVDDTEVDQDGPGEIEETLEAEVEEEPVEAEPEASPDYFKTQLQETFERLQGEMNEAITNRDTAKIGALGVALENLCVKQEDISGSFQAHQQLMDDLEKAMSEVKQVLPGFQMETVQASLLKGENETVHALLLEAAGQLNDSPNLAAEVLYKWGRSCEEGGDLAAALEMYTKAHETDPENPDSLSASGRLERITGDIEKAIPLLEKRVAAGQEKQEESIELAGAEHELAKALTLADKEKEKVEELLNHARETMEKILGSDHPDLGPVLHDLAILYDSEGRYEQAEPVYKKALEVMEKGLGTESPRLGNTLNKLAGLYEEIEMEEKSEPLYTKALEIKQKVVGENHPDIGSIMGHIANLLKMKGKYEQAEPMYRKSLEIAERSLGKDHPNLAVVLNDMAELYSEMGNEEQAEHFQERAFSLFGLPGMGDGFVEMEKDTGHDEDEDSDRTIAGN